LPSIYNFKKVKKLPFTFSHPAAVLPLGVLPKRWISMTALVAGSIAPDFEYFLRLKAITHYSHTWKGIFWFDLPLSVVLAFIFHLIVKKSLINSLPDFLSGRFVAFEKFDWTGYFKKNIPVVIISIIIGAASHLIWDGFTHETGMFINKFEILNHEFHIAGRSMKLFSILQYLSSLFGALLILFVILRLPEDDGFEPDESIIPFWFAVGLVTLVIIAIRLFAGLGSKPAANFIVAAVAGVCAGIFFISLVKGIELKKE
jgi:Domain of unknown function (DUF4184)